MKKVTLTSQLYVLRNLHKLSQKRIFAHIMHFSRKKSKLKKKHIYDTYKMNRILKLSSIPYRLLSSDVCVQKRCKDRRR